MGEEGLSVMPSLGLDSPGSSAPSTLRFGEPTSHPEHSETATSGADSQAESGAAVSSCGTAQLGCAARVFCLHS